MGGQNCKDKPAAGSCCLFLQKKSQKRRFREEPDDEEAEAGTCSQYRGNSSACAQSGAPQRTKTMCLSCTRDGVLLQHS